jgi:hypothetical protein
MSQLYRPQHIITMYVCAVPQDLKWSKSVQQIPAATYAYRREQGRTNTTSTFDSALCSDTLYGHWLINTCWRTVDVEKQTYRRLSFALTARNPTGYITSKVYFLHKLAQKSVNVCVESLHERRTDNARDRPTPVATSGSVSTGRSVVMAWLKSKCQHADIGQRNTSHWVRNLLTNKHARTHTYIHT